MLKKWRGDVIGSMKKIKVIHQVLDPSGSGGVSAEFRALKKSELTQYYEFVPMILVDFHSGINLKDINYYYKFIKKENPDIVHVRGAAVDGLNAIIAAKLAHRGKILVTVHGMYSDLVYISKVKKWISKHVVEKLIFDLSDGISCVCKNATNRSYFDKYRKKMLPYVYNRMPQFSIYLKEEYREEVRRLYGLDSEDIVALYVGRMTKEKGLEVFLNAIKKMQFSWPEHLKILFVGDGSYKSFLENECVEFRDKIFFAGDQRNVEKFYDAADFFIQPSLHENHSISLLEACAAKLPCIATKCGGNTEIVNDQTTGIIIPANDVNALVDAIEKMMDVTTRTYYLENIAREDYTKFSPKETDTALNKVYQMLLER